ncbi:MAG: IPT/TIG domain-containing protein [Bacteroidetes bacterium]|nr:IPT/TIG domain-containing protein [Bacteroidota bacterium]
MKNCTPFLPISIFFLFLFGACKKSPTPPIIPVLPTITSISPSSGNVGTSVTIMGTNFQLVASDNTVKFNGVAATVTSATASSLVVAAPAGGTSGAVTVSTSSGTATGPNFTYLALPVPTITSISPTTGSAGTAVTISGTNFKTTLTDNTVLFNGVAATVTSATTTSIVATAPATGTTGNITVTTSAGTSNGVAFTYTSAPDVYVLGQGSGGYGYWKNDVFTALPSNCLVAQSIFVNGSDIYVAGATSNGAEYWKNGVGVQLPEPSGATNGRAVSIFVSGTDVYVCGYDTKPAGGSEPLYWKNGVLMPISLSSGNINPGLPATGGIASSIFVSGTDVYLAGAQFPFTGNAVATYWKNGSPTTLTSTTFVSAYQAYATGVYVIGSDAYVCGYLDGHSQNYWKNGIAVPLGGISDTLQSFGAGGMGIYVANNGDVLVCGDYHNTAKYWKNGTMYDLTTTPAGTTNSNEYARSITENGTDIYIAGNYYSQGPGFWKNGVFTKLSNASIVYSIVVK